MARTNADRRLLEQLVRERFGDPAETAREGTPPPPLTPKQQAANRRELDKM